MINKETVKVLKALGEETRLQIFEMLRNGPLCACKIQEQFNLTQPTLSHHLKTLCESGIVIAKRDGIWMFYSLNCEMVERVISFFSETACRRNKNKC